MSTLKTKMSLIYKTILALMIIGGIVDRAGILSPVPQWKTFYSFTSISNCFVLIVTLTTIFVILKSKQDKNNLLAQFRGIAVVVIVFVGLAYHFALLPNKIAENPNYQIFTFGNIAAHYLVPIGMLFDWLVFDSKGKINKWTPFIGTIVPLGYFIAACMLGYIGSINNNNSITYVYFFMNIQLLGIAGVALWGITLLVGIAAINYSVYFLDHYCGMHRQPKPH